MRKNLLVSLSIVLSFSLLLSGCNLLSPAPAVPTQSPQSQEATINAAVAQAMQATAAAYTSTAAALPTSTFTLTPTEAPPTNTPMPTNTPQPTATLWVPTATIKPTYPTKTLTPTQAPYSCKVISSSPNAGSKFKNGTDFDATIKVQNTGLKNWEAGYVDLRWVSGTKFQTGGDVFDVNTAVARGGEITLIVDMKAPDTAGKYTAAWVVAMEGITMCTLSVNIEAVNP